MRAADTVFLFSGQGSHYYGMGQDLFETDDVFKGYMRDLDDVAKDLLGFSIVEMLYNPARQRGETFTRTAWSGAAIFMVEYAMAKTLMNYGVQPNCLVGASLGIFAAAAVAACLSAEASLRAVVEQSEIVDAHCAHGSMLALLEGPEIFARSELLQKNTEIAAYNFSSHFAIAVLQDRLPQVEAFLRHRSVLFQRLPVSRPFHSKWMEPAEIPYVSFCETLRISRPDTPLVCCARAAMIDTITPRYLWDIARQPINFERTIALLEHKGPHHYIDVGPAGTLATFAKYGLPANSSSTISSTMTPFAGSGMKSLGTLSHKRNGIT